MSGDKLWDWEGKLFFSMWILFSQQISNLTGHSILCALRWTVNTSGCEVPAQTEWSHLLVRIFSTARGHNTWLRSKMALSSSWCIKHLKLWKPVIFIDWVCDYRHSMIQNQWILLAGEFHLFFFCLFFLRMSFWLAMKRSSHLLMKVILSLWTRHYRQSDHMWNKNVT